ncbi:alpha/beta hydrolase [Sphingomonas bacterium]|uniref:alpha/beta fold hydrolase n=1 Tax=Sphingomonas bacterium TaxID=1895847 RepID=UPI002630AB3F|nr:alpha/beta hydrolase [Sphingomonas bacterium]MDB5678457.1 alpha/beta hydrolase [Sphingomonas bacterium]
MTPQNKARLIAAIALPLLALNVSQARAATNPAACTSPALPERMAHISIAELGARGLPTVILIPGLSSPRDVWAGIAPTLAKTHHVVLVQVNGFGGDDPGANLKPGLLDGVVADLDAYIARNKLSGAAVIGHSMGGLVGMMLAKAHPGDIGKLMIVDSLPWIGVMFGPTLTVAMVEPQGAKMRDTMAAGYGKPDPAGAQAIAARLALKPASQTLVNGWVQKSDARVSAEAFYEDLTTDLRGDMAGIATPITMLYPTSAAMPKATAEPIYRDAYAKAPHVTLIDIDDSAHFIMLDQPEAFAKAVAAFLG